MNSIRVKCTGGKVVGWAEETEPTIWDKYVYPKPFSYPPRTTGVPGEVLPLLCFSCPNNQHPTWRCPSGVSTNLCCNWFGWLGAKIRIRIGIWNAWQPFGDFPHPGRAGLLVTRRSSIQIRGPLLLQHGLAGFGRSLFLGENIHDGQLVIWNRTLCLNPPFLICIYELLPTPHCTTRSARRSSHLEPRFSREIALHRDGEKRSGLSA